VTRFGWVMATYVSGTAATGAAFISPPPKLIWNASASAPIGLYAVRPGALSTKASWSPSGRRSRSRVFLRTAVACRATRR